MCQKGVIALNFHASVCDLHYHQQPPTNNSQRLYSVKQSNRNPSSNRRREGRSKKKPCDFFPLSETCVYYKQAQQQLLLTLLANQPIESDDVREHQYHRTATICPSLAGVRPVSLHAQPLNQAAPFLSRPLVCVCVCTIVRAAFFCNLTNRAKKTAFPCFAQPHQAS